MRLSPVAERYVRALSQALRDPAEIERTGAALADVNRLYREEAAFHTVLANPANALDRRRVVLDTVLDALDAPRVLRGFLHLLLQRNRIGLLPDIAARFDERMDEWLNRVEATVTTAIALPEDSQRRLAASLEQFAGKSVRLKCIVDRDVVDGLVVRMWGVLFDFSLRTRLERVKEFLVAEETLSYGR